MSSLHGSSDWNFPDGIWTPTFGLLTLTFIPGRSDPFHLILHTAAGKVNGPKVAKFLDR